MPFVVKIPETKAGGVTAPRSWKAGRAVFSAVAQVFNLLYRRVAACVAWIGPEIEVSTGAPQIKNLRYSRLEVCATSYIGAGRARGPRAPSMNSRLGETPSPTSCAR